MRLPLLRRQLTALQHRQAQVVERTVDKVFHLLPLDVLLRVQLLLRLDAPDKVRIDHEQIHVLVDAHVDAGDTLRGRIHIAPHHDQPTVLLEVVAQCVRMLGDAVVARDVQHLAGHVVQRVDDVDRLERADPFARPKKSFRLVFDLDQRLLDGGNVRHLAGRGRLWWAVGDDPRADRLQRTVATAPALSGESSEEEQKREEKKH